ncbi:MAG: Ig-like domain-containing protein [Gemmatimonadota bacterium]
MTKSCRRTSGLPVVGMLFILLTGCNSPSDRVGPIAASIEITPRQVELTSVGETASLTATVMNPQGEVITGRQVEWSSTRLDVATVNSSGTVSAEGAGTTTIRAESEGLTDSIEVTVVLDESP